MAVWPRSLQSSRVWVVCMQECMHPSFRGQRCRLPRTVTTEAFWRRCFTLLLTTSGH